MQSSYWRSTDQVAKTLFETLESSGGLLPSNSTEVNNNESRRT
ncbi:hypothetical protein ES703_83369 [subsurface metagenome]